MEFKQSNAKALNVNTKVPVAKIPAGETWFVARVGMYADEAGGLWLHPSESALRRPAGYSESRCRRVNGGLVICAFLDPSVIALSMDGVAGPDDIPVMVVSKEEWSEQFGEDV